MAPFRAARSEETTTRPLADFFWIAGLDGHNLYEAYRSQLPAIDTQLQDGILEQHVVPIQEDAPTEVDISSNLDSPITAKSESQRNSFKRLSQLSNEARRSIQSLDAIAGPRSNRSSAATIRANNSPLPTPSSYRMSTTITDADFEHALKKFTSDRDTFSVDLSFKEDSPVSPNRMRHQSRAQQIIPEEYEDGPNRALDTVRRHMSFREMNSAKRQPSIARRSSIRTSKRMSSYNAVVPKPESIQTSPNEHPLRKTFEPVLLDRFPRPDMTTEMNRRDDFPEYIPMFAFPNDVQIISSDTRPQSTWHEFSMTGADNTKIPAVCIVIWIPMNRETADRLEKLCEEWRKANLTSAERELAASLAERLAHERAKLSRLLSKLPQAASDTIERDELEEQISTVEERINLMAEMLRPLRHGAASRIEGLTDGDTGLWIPRAYGVLGRDESMTPVYKEWLKAVVTPMMNSAILRVPASSPKTGIWQPLERYVYNICCEAPLPISSKLQVELSIRELRLYAKREAANELPGSRSTDLYPLFRALTVPNIVVLFEYLLAEARIIIVSSQATMLKAVSKALVELLWPLEWAGVYIPVLPQRLMQVLEAPCPYICGVVRKGNSIDLPDDDFVMVDLDKNELHATEHPPPIPKQHRRKLASLLHLAAPHHHSKGVPVGAPVYIAQSFPYNTFMSEHNLVFSPSAGTYNLGKLASLSSTAFGPQAAMDQTRRAPILNAFLQANPNTRSMDRPTTSTTVQQRSNPSIERGSPITGEFPPIPAVSVPRNDSAWTLQTSLREKRSGHFDSWSKSSDGISSMRRKASLPFVKHGASLSSISVSPSAGGMSSYAPSSYAQSTLAASTIMPGMNAQPARNTETTLWAEGHCFEWQRSLLRSSCALCDEKIESGFYRCSGCQLVVHNACASQITIVCQSAFYPDQIRAAFARFFASLFYSHRKFTSPVNATQKKTGMSCQINLDAWFRSLPPEHATYMEMLRQTQAFNEFIAEREQVVATSLDSVKLFDSLIAAKRGRSGRMRASVNNLGLGRNPFSSKSSSSTEFLTDASSHVWRVVSVPITSIKPNNQAGARGRDYHSIVTRTPAKLEDDLLDGEGHKDKEKSTNGTTKKIPRRLIMNGLSMNAP